MCNLDCSPGSFSLYVMFPGREREREREGTFEYRNLVPESESLLCHLLAG